MPAFCARALGVAVDAVEESAAPAAAARECFGADFTEEPFGELTREGFRARLSRAPPVGADGKYRVWSGVDARTFLDAAARSSEADGDDAALTASSATSSLAPSHSTPASEIFRTIRASNVLDAERAVVALAGGWTPRRAAVVRCRVRRSPPSAATGPPPRANRTTSPSSTRLFFFFFFEETDEASRPTKRAKSDKDKDKDKDDEIAHRRRFEHAEGRAGVVIVGAGAAAAAGVGGVLGRRSPSPTGEAPPALAARGRRSRVGSRFRRFRRHASLSGVARLRTGPPTKTRRVRSRGGGAAAAAAEARANAGNDAWDVFGDSDAAPPVGRARPGAPGAGMRRVLRLVLAETYPGTGAAALAPRAPPGDVGDARYWTETLGAAVCVGDFSGFPLGSGTLAFPGERYRAEVTEKGYVWGDVVVPPELTSRLAAAIARAAKRGWPPAAVFLCDDAWRAAGALWARAEARLGCPTATRRSWNLPWPRSRWTPPRTKPTPVRREQLGVPHRDYAVRDVRRCGGGGGPEPEDPNRSSSRDAADVTPPEVLSAWLPLVDVTRRNGCMYVVPVAHDARDDATPPAFDRAGAVALAPAPAGSLMAWAGDTTHWGTACARNLPATERRAPLALVFRKERRDATRARRAAHEARAWRARRARFRGGSRWLGTR